MDLVQLQPNLEAVHVLFTPARGGQPQVSVSSSHPGRQGVIRTPVLVCHREARRPQKGDSHNAPSHPGRLQGGIGEVDSRTVGSSYGVKLRYPQGSSSNRFSSHKCSSTTITQKLQLQCPSGFKVCMEEDKEKIECEEWRRKCEASMSEENVNSRQPHVRPQFSRHPTSKFCQGHVGRRPCKSQIGELWRRAEENV